MSVSASQASSVRYRTENLATVLYDAGNAARSFGAETEGCQMADMRLYRAYLLNAGDHVESVTVVEAPDDASACLEADFILRNSPYPAVEVWDEHRLVCHTEREHALPDADSSTAAA